MSMKKKKRALDRTGRMGPQPTHAVDGGLELLAIPGVLAEFERQVGAALVMTARPKTRAQRYTRRMMLTMKANLAAVPRVPARESKQ